MRHGERVRASGKGMTARPHLSASPHTLHLFRTNLVDHFPRVAVCIIQPPHPHVHLLVVAVNPNTLCTAHKRSKCVTPQLQRVAKALVQPRLHPRKEARREHKRCILQHQPSPATPSPLARLWLPRLLQHCVLCQATRQHKVSLPVSLAHLKAQVCTTQHIHHQLRCNARALKRHLNVLPRHLAVAWVEPARLNALGAQRAPKHDMQQPVGVDEDGGGQGWDVFEEQHVASQVQVPMSKAKARNGR